MAIKTTLIQGCNIDNIDTWIRYKTGLCDSCMATCCTMPTEVRVPDLIRLGLVDAFDADEDPKQLAKRLQKAGLIEHFNFRYAIFTLSRRANGDCMYLDAKTRRCTVYENRPETCRNHPKVGPRPGFCAFIGRAEKR